MQQSWRALADPVVLCQRRTCVPLCGVLVLGNHRGHQQVTATSMSWHMANSPCSFWAAPPPFNLVAEGPRRSPFNSEHNWSPLQCLVQRCHQFPLCPYLQAALDISHVVYMAQSSWELLSEGQYLITNKKPLKEKEVSLQLPKQRCLKAYTRRAALMHGQGYKLEEKREPKGRDQREMTGFPSCWGRGLKGEGFLLTRRGKAAGGGKCSSTVELELLWSLDPSHHSGGFAGVGARATLQGLTRWVWCTAQIEERKMRKTFSFCSLVVWHWFRLKRLRYYWCACLLCSLSSRNWRSMCFLSQTD